MSKSLRRTALAAALAVFSAATALAAEIQVVKTGKFYGNVYSYQVEDAFYVSAKDAADIYGANLYWRPVQAQVQLSLRGKQLVFQEGSEQANVDGAAARMARPMLVRTSLALLPVEFFTSPEFSAVAGVDSRFDPKTRLLLVDRRSTVGPARWSTYPDHTRVVLELKGDLGYQTARRGAQGFEVVVANGSIDADDKMEVKDGVVDFIQLGQEPNSARLEVKLQEDALDWKLMELSEPRRLVIDIARRGVPQSPVPSAVVPASAHVPAAPAQAVVQAPAPPAPPSGEGPLMAPPVQEAAPPLPAPAPASEPSPPPPVKEAKRRIRIVIDAGHGGKDSGAPGYRGSREKDINLSAAKELAALFKGKEAFEVLLTRDTDVFIPLHDRPRLANEFNADLFVSLHCNSHRSKSETGYEIYFLSERASDPEAERLAEFENSVLELEGGAGEDEAAGLLYALARTEFINDSAELAGLMTRTLNKRVELPNRGVKQASFAVLRGANSPAVLVEMGFVSNRLDLTRLQSQKYRKKIVEGIHAAILDFAKRKEWLDK